VNSVRLLSVTDPDKDDFFMEIVSNSTKIPIAAIEKNGKEKFELYLFTSDAVDAREFIELVQQAIDQLMES
jgi:hypothetical protein